MDLLSIVRRLWLYKFFTVPVVVLTIFGAAYVVAVKQPVYEAKASFALVAPPAPPSAEDVARDPSLAHVKSDNPYTRFSDQTVIIGVLASTMEGDQARRALVRAGADRRYVVAPSVEFGFSSPIVQITAMSWTAKDAIKSATLVTTAIKQELDRMQAVQGTDKRYRIRSIPVQAPDRAQLQASGKLRMLVGVLVLGAVILFIVISVADALTTLRNEQRQRSVGGPAPVPASNGSHAALDAEPHPIRNEVATDRWDVASVPTGARHPGDLPLRYKKHPGASSR